VNPDDRKPSGMLHLDIGIWQQVELFTTQPIDDEIFSALEYISEVDIVGIKVFKGLAHRNPKETLLKFRAFVRQAKTFYYAAKQLDYRASALLYYYAFLNLAKAYIVMSDPVAVSGDVYHGLVYRSTPGSIDKQGAIVRNGVFRNLYEIETSVRIPVKQKLNIYSLLGYCTDVQYEYELGGFGRTKFTPVLVRILSDKKNKISWPQIAVEDFSIIQPYKKTLKPFENYFEQIVPDKISTRDVFNITAASYSQYTFFQSKRVYQWQGGNMIPTGDIKRDILTALTTLYSPKLHGGILDFYLFAPLRKNLQLPMSQQLAIYVIIFYLGSLVRYNPTYLERLLNSKDAWLIERFVKSSPETFLRYISNAILQKNYIYKPR
jgi:hypothetical protein